MAAINHTQILAGDLIWEELSTEEVRFKITNGERPPMPKGKVKLGATAEMWGMLAKCWEREAEERITIQNTLSFLQYT